MSAEERLLHACRSVDPAPIADLTYDLLRIWSPPGDEAKVAERIAAALETAGARVELDSEFPMSPSVIAELGDRDGPTVQWHGHLDAIETPHKPPERHPDQVVGRGANDMKGPLAAMVEAVKLLRSAGLPDRGRILIVFHGMHESGGSEPLHALIKRGIRGDACVTGELGGGLGLPVAGLGLSIWEISVERPGEVVHETYAKPDTINPIEVGRLIMNRLASLRDELAAAPVLDPKPSLFIGKFASGDYFNRVPVRCEIAGSRRNDATMTLQDVAAELEALVADVRAATGAPIRLKVTGAADSFHVDPEELIVTSLRRAHRELTGREIPLTRSRVVSNASHFVREAGIPCVCYGPDQSTSHSDHEVVSMTDLSRLAGAFALASAYYLKARTKAPAPGEPVTL